MYLLLTDYDTDKELLVNMDRVDCIHPQEHTNLEVGYEDTTYISGCVLSFPGEDLLTVKESFTHINMMLCSKGGEA